MILAHVRVFADNTSLLTLGPGRNRTRNGRIPAYKADDPALAASDRLYLRLYRRDIRPARHLAAFKGTLDYGDFRALADRHNDAAVALAFARPRGQT